MSYRKTVTGIFMMAALLLCGVSQNLYAQTMKIGFTDAELIVAQMPEYRTVMEQLQSMAESGQEEYNALLQNYQEKVADYQKKQALLSDQAKQNREQELVAMQGEIQQFTATKEQELGEKEVELLNPLLERVQTAIDEVASEQGLNLVLNTRAGGSPMILYADQSMDVTEAVLSKLGIQRSTGASSSR